MNEVLLFLKGDFQEQLEQNYTLFNKKAPEETPYVYKYEARKILDLLLKNEKYSEDYVKEQEKQDQQYLMASKLILYYQMGVNLQETEEGHLSEPFYQKCLALFMVLDKDNVYKYYNYLQEIYNHMGLIYLNRDENETGMSFLGKSKDLYESIQQSEPPKLFIVNNSCNFKDKEKQQFNYYYEGGISYNRTEDSYTYTLFYLAQGYTKLDQKELAAEHCGKTMKRQYESGNYDLKDFCVNCMSLADFYGGIKNFKQAEYLLLAAMSILPEGKKKKMRATLEMSLGFLLFEYLKTSVTIINEERLDEKELPIIFNRISLEFKGVELNIKEVTLKKTIDDIKSIFRQANTQFKKALQYFVLDGHVTEHIQIVEHQSDLYKQLAYLEEDPKKAAGLFDRRLELLEPIYDQINPKAYQATYEKLLVQVAEIYCSLLEIKFQELFGEKPTRGLTPKHVQKLNLCCEKVIELYGKIEEVLIDDKETKRDSSYYNSIVTAKFNIAKAYSKAFRQDKEGRVKSLVQSLNKYKDIVSYIQDQIPEDIKEKHYEFDQQLNMSIEMVNLLPNKIDKANAM